jgi:hypothetical protein
VFTSLLMFCLALLRPFHREEPEDLRRWACLFICAVLACIGLNLVSGITTFIGAILALRGVRPRQDLLLAHHAGRGQRPLPAHGRDRHLDHGRHAA